MRSNRGNVPVAIVAVLAILLALSASAAGYFFFQYQQLQQNQTQSVVSQPVPIVTPTPAVTSNPITQSDETANWKIYIDQKYGYSFKYPTDYFKFQGDPTLGFFVATSAPVGGNGPKFLEKNDVWLDTIVWKDTRWQSIQQFLDFQKASFNNLQETSIVMGGVEAKKLDYTMQVFAAGSSSTTIYVLEGMVLRDGKIFTVTLSSFDKNITEGNQPRFDQILSTFKFL